MGLIPETSRCQLVEGPEGIACLVCGYPAATLEDRVCQNKLVHGIHTLTLGPGTELKKLLRRFFIRSRQGCKCDQRVLLMNLEGPDWCTDHLEEIVEWLREAATDRHLPFTAIGARILIRRAISNSRKKLKAVKE